MERRRRKVPPCVVGLNFYLEFLAWVLCLIFSFLELVLNKGACPNTFLNFDFCAFLRNLNVWNPRKRFHQRVLVKKKRKWAENDFETCSAQAWLFFIQTCIALLWCIALPFTEQKERGVAHSLQTRQLTRDGDYIPYPPDDSRV